MLDDGGRVWPPFFLVCLVIELHFLIFVLRGDVCLLPRLRPFRVVLVQIGMMSIWMKLRRLQLDGHQQAFWEFFAKEPWTWKLSTCYLINCLWGPFINPHKMQCPRHFLRGPSVTHVNGKFQMKVAHLALPSHHLLLWSWHVLHVSVSRNHGKPWFMWCHIKNKLKSNMLSLFSSCFVARQL